MSPSPTSLGVTPVTPRSIPNPPLKTIELDWIELLIPDCTATPAAPLNDIVLLDAEPATPIELPDAPRISTPLTELPSDALPEALVPMELPRT